jgi:hypothetical protein
VATAQHAPVPRARWYLNRLRCMEPKEIPHRIARALTTRVEHLVPWPSKIPAPDVAVHETPWVCRAPAVAAAAYFAAADRIVAGKIDIFALRDVPLDSPPRWNRDPRTGVDAPLSFGKLLDYRDPKLVGDIKYLWELNRHLHLVTLAQAFALCGDPVYAATLQRHLDSWFAACPYRLGANWSNALEPAMRLINWALAWQLLGGVRSQWFESVEGAAFRRRWLESIYRHARFVRGYFSRHSSANNHLIGEAVGLFVAGCTFPFWREARRWRAAAAAIVERETLLQNAADGVNREQAVAYQQFELDLLLLAMLAGRARDHRFRPAVERRIVAMLEFVAGIMDAGGNVPAIGDSDDGYVVKLSQEPDFCPFRSVLATGALLFDRGDFRARAGRLDDKTRWLFGEHADARFAACAPRASARRAFTQGGYYVLGCNFESPDEVRVVVDAGPLGYNTIAAHGHADALAFTLSIGGAQFLVDPGTYTYHPEGPWRAYFRSTAAHNTVRVDGKDQSEPGGTFMWLHKANAHCSAWRSTVFSDVFEGWHDGYRRLADPVVHRRRIALDKQTRRIFVDDTLEMSGAHDVELRFHCAEQCGVHPTADGDGYELRRGSRSVVLRLPRADVVHVDVRSGDDELPAGWISRRYGVKEPCTTIVWRARLTGRTLLRTELRC